MPKVGRVTEKQQPRKQTTCVKYGGQDITRCSEFPPMVISEEPRGSGGSCFRGGEGW